MTIIDKLNNYGCNTKEGLERCLNKEDFYIKLLKMSVSDNKIYDLKKFIIDKDYDNAFKISHALKGVFANLSLTPLYNILYNLTEELRIKENKDYTNEINGLVKVFDEIKNIILE
jgi:hypothetical protein